MTMVAMDEDDCLLSEVPKMMSVVLSEKKRETEEQWMKKKMARSNRVTENWRFIRPDCGLQRNSRDRSKTEEQRANEEQCEEGKNKSKKLKKIGEWEREKKREGRAKVARRDGGFECESKFLKERASNQKRERTMAEYQDDGWIEQMLIKLSVRSQWTMLTQPIVWRCVDPKCKKKTEKMSLCWSVAHQSRLVGAPAKIRLSEALTCHE